jgi:hypothetical protein
VNIARNLLSLSRLFVQVISVISKPIMPGQCKMLDLAGLRSWISTLLDLTPPNGIQLDQAGSIIKLGIRLTCPLRLALLHVASRSSKGRATAQGGLACEVSAHAPWAQLPMHSGHCRRLPKMPCLALECDLALPAVILISICTVDDFATR